MLGDMAHPERDLPRVITGAMITVMAGFALMNAAIYICLPFEVIRTSSTVAVVRRTPFVLPQHPPPALPPATPPVIMPQPVFHPHRPTLSDKGGGGAARSPDYLG